MKRRTLLAASALMYRIKLHQYHYNFVKKSTCVQGVLHTTVRTITTKSKLCFGKKLNLAFRRSRLYSGFFIFISTLNTSFQTF